MSVLSKKAMWQRYIDDALLLTEQITNASIHGLDGSRWASTKDFEVKNVFLTVAMEIIEFFFLQVTQDQALRLISAISGETTTLKRSGIKIGKQNYILMNHEPNRSVYGRKGADAGVCVLMTRKTVLVGVYNGGIKASNCNSVMEKLADYLIEHGI